MNTYWKRQTFWIKVILLWFTNTSRKGLILWNKMPIIGFPIPKNPTIDTKTKTLSRSGETLLLDIVYDIIHWIPYT